MEWAEPIAYGALGLKPWEFERLQPQEFYKLIEGYQWREFQQECILAYFTAVNVSPHLKKAISPLSILKGLNPGKIKEIKRAQSVEDEKYLRGTFGKELERYEKKVDVKSLKLAAR